MQSTTSFDDRLLRISARAGRGPELLAGVHEDAGPRPKIRFKREKPARRKGGIALPLLLTCGLFASGAWYLGALPETGADWIGAQIANLQLTIAGYLE